MGTTVKNEQVRFTRRGDEERTHEPKDQKRPVICVPSRVPAQSTPPHTSREMVRLLLVGFGAVHSSAAVFVTFSFAVVEGFDALAAPPVAPPAARCARMRASNSMPPMIASACRRWQLMRVKCSVACPSLSTNGGAALSFQTTSHEIFLFLAPGR